jgi:hypothetical protein
LINQKRELGREIGAVKAVGEVVEAPPGVTSGTASVAPVLECWFNDAGNGSSVEEYYILELIVLEKAYVEGIV